MKFHIGQKVKGPHGLGQVVALNTNTANRYALDHMNEVPQPLLPALIPSFYPKERYPYVVHFDDGYKDVYAESELEAVK